MKKLILIAILTGTSLFAQVNLNVSIRQPTPSSISDWQKDASILQLFVSNLSSTAYKDAYFSFSIYNQNNKNIAYTKDNDRTLPKFTIPAGPPSGSGMLIINGPQLVRVGEIHFDKSLGNVVINTNSLPEGQYQLCIKAFDSKGTNITNNEQTCAYFSIRIPEPPMLISPFDGDTLLTNYQTFSWSPVTGSNLEFGLKYKLKITPLFSGQNGRTAIESNPTLINKLVSSPVYTYLPSDPSFTLFPDAIGFAWQVQALTASGEPAARLDGKSEIRIFYKKKFNPIFVSGPPKLKEPENLSTIKTKTPTFIWAYFPIANENVYYQLKVVALSQFDYPPTAIDKNNVVYERIYNSIPQFFGPSPQTNFQHDLSYAWRVQVIKTGTNEIVHKSEIFVFKYQDVISSLAASFTNVSGKLLYEFADPGEYTGTPLSNANIKLVVKYVMEYNDHTTNITSSANKTGSLILPHAAAIQLGLHDEGNAVGVGKTNPAGSFNFSFLTGDSSNVIVRQNVKYTASSANAGEFYDNYFGDIYRQYRIYIENPHSPYYTNPSTNIVVQPKQNENVGNIFANVRSYGLTVQVESNALNEQLVHGSLGNMIVYLLRDTRPIQVPSNEGSPRPEEPETLFGKEVIAKAVTSGNQNDQYNYGKVHFKKLVKNNGFSDKYYLWTISDPTVGDENYKASSEKMFRFEFDEDAIFNQDYIYPIFEKKIIAKPQLPQVAGMVKRTDSEQPLGGAYVELLNWAVLFWSEEAHWYTYNTGLFKFNNLMVDYNENWQINAPVRALRISKPGFVTRTLSIDGKGINKALKLGEKWKNYELYLTPEAKIIGRIVNELGRGVESNVTLVGGSTVEANLSGQIGPARFSIPSPKGNQTIIIDPVSPEYYRDTITVNVTENVQSIGEIILKEKKHRIIVNVLETEGGIFVTGNEPPVVNAVVQLKILNGDLIEQKGADQTGKVLFDFKSAGDQFTITVKSPLVLPPSTPKDYEAKSINITIPNSKNPKQIKIYIKKAAFISGYVFIGTENKPVNKARVHLISNGLAIETYTNTAGKYTLHNVPIKNYQRFAAGKSSSNYIGDIKTVNVTKDGLDNVNFKLTVYEDMDISKLMGFPIEVTSLSEVGNEIQITGDFIKLDSLVNPIFATSEKSLSFSNVSIKPGNETSIVFDVEVPIAIPKTLPVKTNKATIPLTIFNEFKGNLSDQNNFGIELIEGTNNIGAIGGNCFVDAGSFQIANENLNFEGGGFYLKLPNSNGLKIPVITANTIAPTEIQSGFAVVNKDEKGLKYQLYEYEANADVNNSFLKNNELRLNTTLHTNLTNVEPSDLELNIGEVSISAKKINPINGENTFTINLDQWSIEAKKWELLGYLSINEGILHTAIVDVPITKLNIKPNTVSKGDYNLTQMTVGSIPLDVTEPPVVDYDAANKYWFLSASGSSGNHAASFSNLTGMEPNNKILIEGFTLTSKGSKTFSPVQNQTPSLIHKIGILNPNSIEVFGDYIQISGLSLDIPGYSQIFSIQYARIPNNNVILSLVPNSIQLEANGVRMEYGLNSNDAATQKLDATGFRGRGKVFESGKFSLDTWLYHTVDSTSIWVERLPLQNLPIGGNATYLANVSGSMRVQNKNWSDFTFSGDLSGTKGVDESNNRMTFTVKGEIAASGQELGIKNMETPFGDMSWTYEFENSRLIGNLEFSINVSGTHIDGQAETLVDPSGWYLIAGGKMKLPGLGPAQAAILVGDYPLMPQSVRDIFAECSYKKGLPESFEAQISGFLFSGAIAIPIIIPDVEFDLEILYAKLGIHAGGDARVWMNFDGSGNEYGIGLLAFVHAFVEAGAITCTEVSAHATAELGAEGKYQTSTGMFSFDGCGSFSLGVHVNQKLYACDLDGCGCMGTIFDAGFEYGIKNLIHFDSQGNKSFKFELGTCSGQ